MLISHISYLLLHDAHLHGMVSRIHHLIHLQSLGDLVRDEDHRHLAPDD